MAKRKIVRTLYPWEIGKKYKTSGGFRARIYALDGGEPLTIHGAVWYTSPCTVNCIKGWVEVAWNANGEAPMDADDDLTFKALK